MRFPPVWYHTRATELRAIKSEQRKNKNTWMRNEQTEISNPSTLHIPSGKSRGLRCGCLGPPGFAAPNLGIDLAPSASSWVFFCHWSISLPTPWYGRSGDGE